MLSCAKSSSLYRIYKKEELGACSTHTRKAFNCAVNYTKIYLKAKYITKQETAKERVREGDKGR